MDEWDDDERSPTEGQGELIIAKHRNGGLDNIRLKFRAQFAKFSDLDEFEHENDSVTNESMVSNIPSSMNKDNDMDFEEEEEEAF